jgi:hypothetical protein
MHGVILLSVTRQGNAALAGLFAGRTISDYFRLFISAASSIQSGQVGQYRSNAEQYQAGAEAI